MSVFELASNLPRLKRIGLVRVSRTTQDCHHWEVPASKFFRILQVNNLTDQAVTSLVERTSLERIHLSYCEHVTVDAIHFLLQRLNRLTHLSLTGVPAFRRPDLQKWCRPPPQVNPLSCRSTLCKRQLIPCPCRWRRISTLTRGARSASTPAKGSVNFDDTSTRSIRPNLPRMRICRWGRLTWHIDPEGAFRS